MPRLSRRMLPQRARVLRNSPTPDGSGGWTENFAEVGEGLPCRVGASPVASRSEDGRLVADLLASAWFDPGADVRAGDRIEVGGATYVVNSAIEQADGAYRKAALGTEQS